MNNTDTGNYTACKRGYKVADTHGKIHYAVKAVARSCLAATLAVTAVAALPLVTGSWGGGAAMADSRPRPPLTLTVSSPTTAKVGVPLEGINVHLVNPSLALRDSRLRLIVHDGMERSVGPDDIKIDVLENNQWQPILVELIDEGVIGAIGAPGEVHNDPHKGGGFSIGNKANSTWQLRVTFRSSGHYTMVMSVSPDNGETQLAQPVVLNLEAL
ncbi:hypothetical protein [Methylovulum psychrotolerans]|uniref:Uncharacterized protein n=1 Tax=Methylovulum psychrotolerans TaxID=1704499 RepID=A0A2S5CGC4_9GAMM|nr:hypothetical protein [Methylovulum psychrotolerans]POZ49860.1 hypothetical protein AADEFJLK_04376 [Methylovulum psychrotolerans]